MTKTDMAKIARLVDDPHAEARAAKDAEIAALRSVLDRCRTVLGNMALENDGSGFKSVFNRWPINHEPLRADARGLLPVILAALEMSGGVK